MSDQYKSAWSPREYLAQYYATPGVAEDERGIFLFILDFLKTHSGFKEMLEVGCGPTIHHILPFIPHVDHLYMADYLEANLKEIQKWADQDRGAHDWTQYLSGVLALEGDDSMLAIHERMHGLRTKIVDLLPCNVLDQNPVGEPRTFELVTSFYTLECLTPLKEEWRKNMGNLASLVAPKGWLVLSSLHKADKYMVCGQEFPTTNVTRDDMREVLIASGFRPDTIDIRVCVCAEWGKEGFDSIIICSAQKEGAQI